ncbi:MAG: stage II sporulation protein P [Faecalibacillus sp.]
MNLKVSIQIILKLAMIILLILYLPTYSVHNAQVFKAIEPTEMANATKPVATTTSVTSSKKVHIYNTHQGEKYNGYDVQAGAGYLQECLNKIGYNCDVEKNDFENYKSIHHIAYNKSYTVSKMYLESAVKQNGQYDLIIDFHRDSVDRKYSTVTYQNQSYAKIMFVVGKSSGKFEEVNALSQTLSNKANEYVEGISRGIMVKQSHYNQGIYDHTILIEFGGQSNTKEEVQNTIQVVSLVIKDYLQ